MDKWRQEGAALFVSLVLAHEIFVAPFPAALVPAAGLRVVSRDRAVLR